MVVMYNENDDNIDADIKNKSNVWLSSQGVDEKKELQKRIKILTDMLVKLDEENKELKGKLLEYEVHP